MLPEANAPPAPLTAGIGKIAKVPLREVWKHEAQHLTTWLERNLDVLSETTGLTLTEVKREAVVGGLSLDLSAIDKWTGDRVIIENQLERSDHGHLGQLITYLAGIEKVKVAIWIVSDARPEHVKAVAWLNESTTGIRFYLLKIEAVRIGSSPAAPLLTLITGPSPATEQIRSQKRELSEDELQCREFWAGLLDKAAGRPPLFAGATPPAYHWLSRKVGPLLTLEYVIYKNRGGRVELYVERGDGTGLSLFDRLAANKKQIEGVFGESLDWVRKEVRGACTVGKSLPTGGYAMRDKWGQLQDDMVDAMIRLEVALRPHLASFPTSASTYSPDRTGTLTAG